MNERDIFIEALQRPTPADRLAYLELACAGDDRLRSRVEDLLAALDKADGFLREPSVASVKTVDRPSDPRAIPSGCEPPGTVIGPYKLLEQIGEGGMGAVYMAKQTHPVHRKVALKIVKPGMDTKQVIARFEVERQALALMDHPNIARVFDAGATESGRPYFVMELVRGIPVTDYCDRARLAVHARLGLFVQVCQAVQHAHQKGVIHRDLKPSNILVTLHDGVPVPKVIDFGIAKATGQQLTDKTLFTAFAQFVGTPLYMSPEQAEMSGLDVDTRSDVYSLGVLLYELLTGTTPFDKETLRKAAFDEIRRIFREEDPPTPSTRLSSLGETLTGVSAKRGSEPRRLGKLVRGELDWIVMKALEKDRNRRYETANGLAADVRNYLSGESVQACPPSAWYQFSKVARRNRVTLVTSALVASALALGTAVSTWQAVRSTRSERAALRSEATALRERDRAVKAEGQATDSAKRAQTEASIAEAVNDFLREDLLAQASPEKQPDRDLKLRTVLDRAAGRLAGRFRRQPLVEAALRQTIGDTYVALGLGEARPHLERAYELRLRELGARHSDTLEAMTSLAGVYLSAGQVDKAEPLLVGALEVGRRDLGEDHPRTLLAMGRLGTLYREQGRLNEAEPLIVKALEGRKRALGEGHQDTLMGINNLLKLYEVQGKSAEADSLAAEGLEISRRVLGEEHPQTLILMGHVAGSYSRRGKLSEAEAVLLKRLEISRHVLGEEHPQTLGCMIHLGAVRLNLGKLNEAEPVIVKAVELSRRIRGEEDPETLNVMLYLADLHQRQGKLTQAEAILTQAVAVGRRVHGSEHPVTLSSMFFLATFYQGQGRLTEAQPLLACMVESLRRGRIAEAPPLHRALASLSLNLLLQGRFAEAEPAARECLTIRREILPEDWSCFNAESMLGRSLLGQKKYAEAELRLLSGYNGLKARESRIPALSKSRLPEAGEPIVQLYEAWGKSERAAAWKAKLGLADLPSDVFARP